MEYWSAMKLQLGNNFNDIYYVEEFLFQINTGWEG